MEHKSVVGTLTYVSHAPNGTGYYFQTDSGEFLDLKFCAEEDADTVPRNEKIALCMSIETVDGYRVVCTHKPFFAVLESRMRLAANAALVKKHIGVFRQVAPDTSEDKIERLREEVIENAKILEDYWRRYARHVWDVQVRGYLMIGTESTLPPTYAQNDIRTFMEENDMEGFDPNYFHVHGGFNPNACGHGDVPGNRSSTYLSYGGCGVKTMIHELGHNFGLWHASTRDPDGSTVMYGDGTSIMGSNSDIRGLNGPNLINLKLEDERETLNIDRTQQILLAPVELSAHELHDNEYQHARIKKNRVTHHFSIRKMKERGGFYFNGNEPETLYVHEAPAREKSMRELPDMQPGDTKKLIDGTMIEYLEYANETARVNIYYNKNDPRPEDIPMPEGFPSVMSTAPPSSKYNGLWWNKDFDGEGFDIHIDDDAAVVYWFTYNQENTARRFYIGNCPLDGNTLDFDIFTTENGTWGNPNQHESVLAGKGQLYFLDAEHAIFNYNTEEHGRGSVELTPLVMSPNHPSNGVYYQPSRNGEGVSIQFFSHLKSCVMYLYSYGPKKNNKPNTEQRWYACHGTDNEDGTYDIKLYEAVDNTWMGFRDAPNVNPVGTGKLTAISPNALDFEYNIAADGVNGSVGLSLKRLF